MKAALNKLQFIPIKNPSNFSYHHPHDLTLLYSAMHTPLSLTAHNNYEGRLRQEDLCLVTWEYMCSHIALLIF